MDLFKCKCKKAEDESESVDRSTCQEVGLAVTAVVGIYYMLSKPEHILG